MKKVLIVVGIVTVIGIMVVLNLTLNNKDEDSADGGFVFGGSKAQEVETIEISKSSISSSVLITGSVEVIDKKDVIATSSMKVLEVLVKEGANVKQGDKLLTLDTSSLEEELAGLQLNYDIQSLQLEKIKSATTTSSASGAQIALELSKINLNSAQKAYDDQLELIAKNKALLEEGIVSQSEVDALEKNLESLQQQIDIAQLNLNRSELDVQQISQSSASSENSLSIDIEIQLKNLESLDLNIKKIEKQINELNEATLSPMTGTITSLSVENNQVIMSGSPFMTIQNMEKLCIKANVREYDIRDMAIGQKVMISGDAIPKDVEVTGEISFIAPVAVEAMINGKLATGIEIKIDVVAGTDVLKPGFTADCEIMTQYKDNIIIASYELFREDKENNKLVYVVEDGIVREQIIVLGITSDFDAEVVEGLKEGDIVVVNPSLTLKDGTKVTVVNSEEEGE